jgi:opacity protein-like surface antigen
MQKVRAIILTLAASSALSGAAGAATALSEPGLYGSFAAGLDSMSPRGLQINGFSATSIWKPGWGFAAALGYKFDFGLRAEAEYSYRDEEVKAFNANPWYGRQWDDSAMANLIYELNTGTAFMPYVGGGVGLAHISWGENFRATGPIVYDGTEVRFTWQGIVGIAYAVTPRLTLTVDGRIKESDGYTFPGSAPGLSIKNFNDLTRSVFVGLRYALH